MGLGPGNLNQNGQKQTPLLMLPTKKTRPISKIFFSLQARRHAAFFEGLTLNSSLTIGGGVMELQNGTKSAPQCMISKYGYTCTLAPNMLIRNSNVATLSK